MPSEARTAAAESLNSASASEILAGALRDHRGVKIIGATSHYVTEELDEGPIIEQDITRVSHSHSIEDFITKGRDLERMVLARAIKLHSERKTIVYNNKTVVFS